MKFEMSGTAPVTSVPSTAAPGMKIGVSTPASRMARIIVAAAGTTDGSTITSAPAAASRRRDTFGDGSSASLPVKVSSPTISPPRSVNRCFQ